MFYWLILLVLPKSQQFYLTPGKSEQNGNSHTHWGFNLKTEDTNEEQLRSLLRPELKKGLRQESIFDLNYFYVHVVCQIFRIGLTENSKQCQP